VAVKVSEVPVQMLVVPLGTIVTEGVTVLTGTGPNEQVFVQVAVADDTFSEYEPPLPPEATFTDEPDAVVPPPTNVGPPVMVQLKVGPPDAATV
jgi:hypothetical protein